MQINKETPTPTVRFQSSLPIDIWKEKEMPSLSLDTRVVTISPRLKTSPPRVIFETKSNNGKAHRKRSRSWSRHKMVADDETTKVTVVWLDKIKSNPIKKDSTTEYQNNNDRPCTVFNTKLIGILTAITFSPSLSPSLPELRKITKQFWLHVFQGENVKLNVDLLRIFHKKILSHAIEQTYEFQKTLFNFKNTEKIGSPLSNYLSNLFEGLIGPASAEKEIEHCGLNYPNFINLKQNLEDGKKEGRFDLEVYKLLKSLLPLTNKDDWRSFSKEWYCSEAAPLKKSAQIELDLHQISPVGVYRSIIPEGTQVIMDVIINAEVLFKAGQKNVTSSKVFEAILDAIYKRKNEDFMHSAYKAKAERQVILDYQVKIFLVLSSVASKEIAFKDKLEEFLAKQEWKQIKDLFKRTFLNHPTEIISKHTPINWAYLKKKWESNKEEFELRKAIEEKKGSEEKTDPYHPFCLELLHILMPALSILQFLSINAVKPFRELAILAIKELACNGSPELELKCIQSTDSDYKKFHSLEVSKEGYLFERTLQLGLYPIMKNGRGEDRCCRSGEKFATFNLKVSIDLDVLGFKVNMDCPGLILTQKFKEEGYKEYSKRVYQVIKKLGGTRFFPQKISMSSKPVEEIKLTAN